MAITLASPSTLPAAAGEVAQKQTLAVGPALCDRVKQHLEEMGQTLAPPEAAPAAAAASAGEHQQGAAEPAGEEQQGEEEQRPGKKAKKGSAGAEAAGQEQAAQPVAAAGQQQAQAQRKSKLQSADDLEGDFAGMPLLGVSGSGSDLKGARLAWG